MNAEINIYNPDTLGAPLGQYCHVTRVKATEFLFIAGSLAADKEGNFIGRTDFYKQVISLLINEANLQLFLLFHKKMNDF